MIVWNNVGLKIPSDIFLPDIGVPIYIIQSEVNSLNNRFLPYDVIKTDCIFQIDDDTRYLNKTDLDHGFR